MGRAARCIITLPSRSKVQTRLYLKFVCGENFRKTSRSTEVLCLSRRDDFANAVIFEFAWWCTSGSMTLVVDNSVPATKTVSSGYRRPYRRYRRYSRRNAYRRYARRRTYRTARRRMRARRAALTRYAIANIDPFNVDATGCKIPDANTYPSHAFRVDDSQAALQADANGLRACVFIPTLKNQFIGHTAATGTTWTWSAGYGGTQDSSRLTAIASQYTLFRPVAHGLRISCPGAPTGVTGNVHVAVVAQSEWGATTWGFPTSIAMLSNAMFYRRYPLAQFTQQSLTIVNKFLDNTSQRYIDVNSDGIGPTTNDNNFQTNGWAAIMVVIEGAVANSVCVEIENVVHVEAIPKKDGISSATPAASYNVSVLEEVSHLAGQTPAAFADEERSSYLSQVTQAMQGGVRSAARNVFYDAVIPAAASFGAYAVNRAVYGLPGITTNRNPSMFAD